MKKLPLDPLEEKLGHRFANPQLLEQALTHSSLNEHHYEKLEFLGDAVLQFVVSQELYQRYPDFREGRLTELRAHLVRATHLAKCARALDLGAYLRLSASEEKLGTRASQSLLADIMEATLAALYLDGGLAVTRQLILDRIVWPELESFAGDVDAVRESDHKSRLQELLHVVGRPDPEYETVGFEGPPHCRVFTVRVSVRRSTGEMDFSFEAQGPSKKEASRGAAQLAIEHLKGQSRG